MRERIFTLLGEHASAEAVTWLQRTVASLEVDFEPRPFYYAFSGVSRHFRKGAEIGDEADDLLGGWDEFRLARVALLLTLAKQRKDLFVETYHALLDTADLREQIALFSALPWLPHAEQLTDAAVDGLRTNIVDVFDSIALDNSFPAENFPVEAWNQMVLKAIFITRPLYRVVGIGDRKNQLLTEAISDLAHERWSAGRSITPEAWRSCEGFIDDRLAGDIEKMAKSEDGEDRAAAALVISSDTSGKLDSLRSILPAEQSRIDDGSLTWKSLGEAMEKKLTRKSLT